MGGAVRNNSSPSLGIFTTLARGFACWRNSTPPFATARETRRCLAPLHKIKKTPFGVFLILWRWAVANPRAKSYLMRVYMCSCFLLILRQALKLRTLETTKHTQSELRLFRLVSEARHSPILKKLCPLYLLEIHTKDIRLAYIIKRTRN